MRYALAGLAAAVVVFLATRFLIRPPERSPVPPLDKLYSAHVAKALEGDEGDPEGDWTRILAGRPKRRPQPAFCADCHTVRNGAKSCPDCHVEGSAELRARAAVCGECHRRYDVEWRHAETGARVLEPRHPQYEMWSLGPHAKAGVSCPYCHMPASRRGALRITDHRTRSPLKGVESSCGRCHRASPEELRARILTVQARTQELAARARSALLDALDAIHDAQAAGLPRPRALELQTEAQWRLEYVANDRSKGFHAPQESARLLVEAIDFARQAQLACR